MIVVEGPDGAGKTTLVNKLLATFPELRLGERGTDNRDELWKVTVADTHRALSEMVFGANQPYLWDRLYYSELVYAPAVGDREPMFNSEQQIHVQRVIEAVACPVILCLPPFAVVEDNVRGEGHQMGGVAEAIEDIYQRYCVLWDDGIFPEGATMLYDYTDEDAESSLDLIINEIDDYLEGRLARSWS